VAWLIVQDPFTVAMTKFAEPPVTTGVIVPVPTAGPIEAGLFVQLRPVVNEPVTLQADGVRAAPLYTPVKTPAVAVTDTGEIVNVAEFELEV